jgi:hypothetical protein
MEIESCWKKLLLPCGIMAKPMPVCCVSDKLKQLTVLHFRAIVCLPVDLLDDLFNLCELVLEEVSFSSALRKRKPQQPIYLETLVIRGFIASVDHFAMYIATDKTCNLDFSHLKTFRYADCNLLPRHYVGLARLVIQKCQSSLENFDFWSTKLSKYLVCQAL